MSLPDHLPSKLVLTALAATGATQARVALELAFAPALAASPVRAVAAAVGLPLGTCYRALATVRATDLVARLVSMVPTAPPVPLVEHERSTPGTRSVPHLEHEPTQPSETSSVPHVEHGTPQVTEEYVNTHSYDTSPLAASGEQLLLGGQQTGQRAPKRKRAARTKGGQVSRPQQPAAEPWLAELALEWVETAAGLRGLEASQPVLARSEVRRRTSRDAAIQALGRTWRRVQRTPGVEHTQEAFTRVVRYAARDAFWRGQFQSAAKFTRTDRDGIWWYERMLAEMARAQTGPRPAARRPGNPGPAEARPASEWEF